MMPRDVPKVTFILPKGLSVYVDLQIWHFRDQIPTLS